MADVATKNKSMSVVSNNSSNKSKTKKSDVCGVQSNNGLIDLESLSASNNQLITLCDDDDDDDELILANNTRNELSAEDKSLQELIESELALRICSSTEPSLELEENDNDEDSVKIQPEIRKIILEPRQDPLDVSAEFIVAEMDHYTMIEEPYGFRNGHVSPDSKASRSPEVSEEDVPHSVNFRPEEEDVFDGQIESTDNEVTYGEASSPSSSTMKDTNEESDKDLKVQEEDLVNIYDEACPFENADEDSSQEISHRTVLSSDKYLQEEELQAKDLEEVSLLVCVDDDPPKVEELQDEEPPRRTEGSTEFDERIKESSRDATFTTALLESEVRDSLMNANDDVNCGKCDIQIVVEQSEETNKNGIVQEGIYDEVHTMCEPQEPISSKEAAGMDEKACSFYAEAVANGKIIDNDTTAEAVHINDYEERRRVDIDVTDFKGPDDAKGNTLESWTTVEEAVKFRDEERETPAGPDGEEIFAAEDIQVDSETRQEIDDVLGLETENNLLAPLATPDEISDISNPCEDVSVVFLY